MYMEEVQKHINYLADKNVSYDEKINNYTTLADSLMQWENQSNAKHIWGMVTSALAYADVLTDGQKTVINSLFELQVKGSFSGVEVINYFSNSLKRSEISLDKHLLAKFDPHEIVLARELCYKFLSETEGARLEHLIFTVAELTAMNMGVKDYDLKHVNEKAYQAYTRFVLSDLVPDEDKPRLLKHAREVFYNE